VGSEWGHAHLSPCDRTDEANPTIVATSAPFGPARSRQVPCPAFQWKIIQMTGNVAQAVDLHQFRPNAHQSIALETLYLTSFGSVRIGLGLGLQKIDQKLRDRDAIFRSLRPVFEVERSVLSCRSQKKLGRTWKELSIDVHVHQIR
jgi:hypothetical protein